MPSAEAVRAACARAAMPWPARLVLAVVAVGGSVGLAGVGLTQGWHAPLMALAALAALGWALGLVLARRQRQHLRALARGRAGEDIGHFARQANCRTHDPWVVRAVYEALAQELAAQARLPRFALRWDDDLWRSLRLDADDVDGHLLPLIAARAGRSLAATAANPWHGRVRTAGDLVRFLCAQPCAGHPPFSLKPAHAC